jgi:hypothetical protein
MLRSQEPGNSNLDQCENVAVNVVDAICSAASRPIEPVLRPWHGTRYFPVSVVFLSTMLMLFLPAFRTFPRLCKCKCHHQAPPA